MAKVFFLGAFLLSFLAKDHLLSKGRFPARGFAPVLTDEEAELRLNRYRGFLTRDLNKTAHHQAYSMRFRLRHMPRRGEESQLSGILSGQSLGHGTSRIDFDALDINGTRVSFLLINSDKPKAWRYSFEGGKTEELDSAAMLAPFVQGMNQSSFELLMPFVFWDATYEKSGKVAGRPAHIYIFECPPWVKEVRPSWNRITLALDDGYEAPLRVETFSNRSVAHKTYLLNSLKKIGTTWIPKTFDCKNRNDRSNTRFEVLSAALELDLDTTLFKPEGLNRELSVPQESYLSTE
jgi:hypothetical protein